MPKRGRNRKGVATKSVAVYTEAAVHDKVVNFLDTQYHLGYSSAIRIFESYVVKHMHKNKAMLDNIFIHNVSEQKVGRFVQHNTREKVITALQKYPNGLLVNDVIRLTGLTLSLIASLLKQKNNPCIVYYAPALTMDFKLRQQRFLQLKEEFRKQ